MVEEDDNEGYIEELIECPFCGGFVPDEFECILCGEEILDTDKVGKTKLVCSRCGAEIEEETESCPDCGALF
ncbi:MAG: zinc-ribbon domain-containing protein [Candidatus Thermoplasmatota archaeon]